jgi:hypothetical protein
MPYNQVRAQPIHVKQNTTKRREQLWERLGILWAFLFFSFSIAEKLSFLSTLVFLTACHVHVSQGEGMAGKIERETS